MQVVLLLRLLQLLQLQRLPLRLLRPQHLRCLPRLLQQRLPARFAAKHRPLFLEVALARRPRTRPLRTWTWAATDRHRLRAAREELGYLTAASVALALRQTSGFALSDGSDGRSDGHYDSSGSLSD